MQTEGVTMEQQILQGADPIYTICQLWGLQKYIETEGLPLQHSACLAQLIGTGS